MKVDECEEMFETMARYGYAKLEVVVEVNGKLVTLKSLRTEEKDGKRFARLILSNFEVCL